MVLKIASSTLQAAAAGGNASMPASSCEAVVAAMATVSALSVIHLLRIARIGIWKVLARKTRGMRIYILARVATA